MIGLYKLTCRLFKCRILLPAGRFLPKENGLLSLAGYRPRQRSRKAGPGLISPPATAYAPSGNEMTSSTPIFRPPFQTNQADT
jgi:hypothetical protein